MKVFNVFIVSSLAPPSPDEFPFCMWWSWWDLWLVCFLRKVLVVLPQLVSNPGFKWVSHLGYWLSGSLRLCYLAMTLLLYNQLHSKIKGLFSVLKWQIVICKQIGSHQINLINRFKCLNSLSSNQFNFQSLFLKNFILKSRSLEVFLAWYKLLKIFDWLTLYHIWVNIHLKKSW